jgi:hypothetical protein
MRDLSRKVLILTPHLGDAVLNCGELVAAHPGAVVMTVFAGIPSDAYVVPEWDAACGFSSPRQAVTVRRREERRALEALDAEPCWLACPESQYRRAASFEDTVLRLVGGLACESLVYDDALPGPNRQAVDERIARLPAAPYELPADAYRAYLKQRAAENYESLQRGFQRAGRDLRATLKLPERYWRLRPR